MIAQTKLLTPFVAVVGKICKHTYNNYLNYTIKPCLKGCTFETEYTSFIFFDFRSISKSTAPHYAFAIRKYPT
jgi:hypothetical protein